MTLEIHANRGTPVEQQRFTWRELVQKPISKLDDDAFTRVRVIYMNGIENEALRFQHAAARFNADLRIPLAEIRRVEHHQATLVNWLIGADHSPLETTIGYEQVAIEVTAAMAQLEPDPYVAANMRFGLLEDFDHMHRYSALLDRLEGKDANNILQSYTDILPGRTMLRLRPCSLSASMIGSSNPRSISCAAATACCTSSPRAWTSCAGWHRAPTRPRCVW